MINVIETIHACVLNVYMCVWIYESTCFCVYVWVCVHACTFLCLITCVFRWLQFMYNYMIRHNAYEKMSYCGRSSFVICNAGGLLRAWFVDYFVSSAIRATLYLLMALCFSWFWLIDIFSRIGRRWTILNVYCYWLVLFIWYQSHLSASDDVYMFWRNFKTLCSDIT